jgi:hypothetical protein
LLRASLTVGNPVLADVGLLCIGNSDFDAIENHRQDEFLAAAPGIPGRLDAAHAVGCAAKVSMPNVDALSVA